MILSNANTFPKTKAVISVDLWILCQRLPVSWIFYIQPASRVELFGLWIEDRISCHCPGGKRNQSR